jgi:hypothetical protein
VSAGWSQPTASEVHSSTPAAVNARALWVAVQATTSLPGTPSMLPAGDPAAAPDRVDHRRDGPLLDEGAVLDRHRAQRAIVVVVAARERAEHDLRDVALVDDAVAIVVVELDDDRRHHHVAARPRVLEHRLEALLRDHLALRQAIDRVDLGLDPGGALRRARQALAPSPAAPRPGTGHRPSCPARPANIRSSCPPGTRWRRCTAPQAPRTAGTSTPAPRRNTASCRPARSGSTRHRCTRPPDTAPRCTRRPCPCSCSCPSCPRRRRWWSVRCPHRCCSGSSG